jgi:hypothetical protein
MAAEPMMARWFALLAFLTLGMRPFGWSVEPLKVTEVRQGLVTMVGEDSVYQIEAAEAWQVGYRAEAIVRDGRIVEVRFAK